MPLLIKRVRNGWNLNGSWHIYSPVLSPHPVPLMHNHRAMRSASHIKCSSLPYSMMGMSIPILSRPPAQDST